MYYLICHLSKCAVTIVKALLKFFSRLTEKNLEAYWNFLLKTILTQSIRLAQGFLQQVLKPRWMTWNSFSTEPQKRKNNPIHIKESGTSVLGFFLVLSFQNIFLKVFQGFILFFCFKKSSQRAYFGGRYHIFGVADSFFGVKNYSDGVWDSVFEVLNLAVGVLDSSVGVQDSIAEV